MCGGAFGYGVNLFFPDIAGDIGAYALVGMAAVFAAAARAPLTAMLIVFEMSNDYYLILPLMVAGVVATFVAEWLHKESIYTIKLAKRGIHFSQGRDMDVMQEVLVEDVMNEEPYTFDVNLPFSDLYTVFQETHFQGFPVTQGKGRLYGIVTMQDMTRVLLNNDKITDLKVIDVATSDPITVFPDEPVWTAIQKMSPRDLARLPVVSREDENELVGLISRSDILRAYDVGIMRKQQAQYARERMALRKISEVEFLEIRVVYGAAVAGKNLSEIDLPHEANVISVERGGVVLIPRGNTCVQENDMFTILCRADSAEKVREIFNKL
jgi:CIC family chloride channel protein